MGRKIDELISPKELKNTCNEVNVAVSRVYGRDFPKFYENFLWEKGFGLTVFSSEHNDSVIYDSWTDEYRDIVKLLNNVIGVWLNKHDDLVLNFRQFMFGSSNDNFCDKCMKHYDSKESNHMCYYT